MNPVTTIAEYATITQAERLNLFDQGLPVALTGWRDEDIYQLLKAVALDGSENTYLRKLALAAITDFTLLRRFKIRKALTLLIDEWPKNQDLFLEVQRLKDLYLFYPEEKIDIENILQSYTNSEEAELSSEANYLMGLIKFQASIEASDPDQQISLIRQSQVYLLLANQESENRTDAVFMQKVTAIVTNAATNHWDDLDTNLQALARSLFQLQAYAVNFRPNVFFISLYRSVCALHSLMLRPVSTWLDFRTELTSVYNHYYALQNQKIKDRLAQSDLAASFVQLLTTTYIEPYYALNLSADLIRIEARLKEIDASSEEGLFLTHLHALIKNDPDKKKADVDSLKKILERVFPNRNDEFLQATLDKVTDETDPVQILDAYMAMTLPTLDKFLDDVVSVCLQLQGMKQYRADCQENIRNSFIASGLQLSGWFVKDQTLWSVSPAGKSAGEIDIYVQDARRRPFAIIEALNLDSLKNDNLVSHLNKLFTYDTAGAFSQFHLGLWYGYQFYNLLGEIYGLRKKSSFSLPLSGTGRNNQLPICQY